MNKRIASIISRSCMLLCAVVSQDGYAEGRKALIVGNSAYSSGPLRNPVNDAMLMSQTLQHLGFEVTLAKNASLREMEAAVRDYSQKLSGADVALFYYAGHAVQINGHNYLIPVQAKIQKDTDVKYEAYDVGKILDELALAGPPVSIVILDSCRDNPFARSFRSANSGLAQMDAPKGVIIAYSTAPGSVAMDGDGVNSPYSAALARHMLTADVDIEQVFKRTRRDVDAASGGRQTPWESTSLIGDFYFSNNRGLSVVPAPDIPPATMAAEVVAPRIEPSGRPLGVVESVNRDWGYVVLALDRPGEVKEGDNVVVEQDGERREITIKRISGNKASGVEVNGSLDFRAGSRVEGITR